MTNNTVDSKDSFTTFEGYLRDYHSFISMELDDEMPCGFDTWVADQNIDDITELAEKWSFDCIRPVYDRVIGEIKESYTHNDKVKEELIRFYKFLYEDSPFEDGAEDAVAQFEESKK